MSKIRSANTKPELMVRKFLFRQGYRFRVNVKRLPGTPDIVISRCHTAIFVHGCFWHGHENCHLYSMPKSHTDFWQKKIERNRERDAKVKERLIAMGWNVIVIWECQLKPSVRKQTLEQLAHWLRVFFLRRYGWNETEPDNAAIAAEPPEAYHAKPTDTDDDAKTAEDKH